MHFGLTNTSAIFQAYIKNCLWTNIDSIAIGCLDDIPIYPTNKKEEEDH